MAALTADDLTESTWMPEAFGLDPATMLHRVFSVAVPANVVDTLEPRGREPLPNEGVSETVLRVRMAFQIKGDAARTTYDAALDLEHRALKAMLALNAVHFRVRPRIPMSRVSSPDGRWLLSSIDLTIQHRLALA